MNTKRIVLAALAAFVVIFVLDILAHGKLLMGLYQQTESVWREKGQARGMMWLMTVGQLLFALLFTWIYAKGYEANKPGLGQGLRYGLLIGLLCAISYISVWYVVLPIPLSLAVGWVVASLADCLAAGAVVGLIYRPLRAR